MLYTMYTILYRLLYNIVYRYIIYICIVADFFLYLTVPSRKPKTLRGSSINNVSQKTEVSVIMGRLFVWYCDIWGLVGVGGDLWGLGGAVGLGAGGGGGSVRTL